MFFPLFFKECRQIAKSLVYYLYLIILVLFLTSQLSDGDWSDRLTEPKPGQESYGFKESEDETLIMESTLAELVRETDWNSYATYPFMFYKEVTLNDSELAEIEQILFECTGKSFEQLLDEMDAHFSGYDQSTMEGAPISGQTFLVEPAEDLTFEEFQNAMKRVCGIIGKGSAFEPEKLTASEPKTYEDALEDYRALCEKDKVTGAYMRLFCDYAGIMLVILPIFLGATRCLRDKRADAQQVIYAKAASSLQVVGSRYLANLFMAFLPVVLIAFLLQSPYLYLARTNGVAPDVFAFLKYSVGWLLPTLMVTLALSFVLTELIGNVFAVILQVFWSFACIALETSLVGEFGFHLEPRWNTVGNTQSFFAQLGQLAINRLFYLLLAILLFGLTVLIFDRKRKGGVFWHGKNSKSRG